MEANKDLGQHFMVDTSLLTRIVDAAKLESDQSVLEIGPGPGALTSLLQEVTAKLITVDVDPRFDADIHA
ncbi:MAG: 16S rRNA (adenine(1518)-N(6)/adenine(1519)-N(6))-dimethyltransferase, partial [Nanoarchaeota archaeon]|nr:16S rRNA (adenine(1518)-N(6)/adenine(1519)-N(6))-dimethyltransferase [Nanoarchaeota archaeon]